MMLTLFRSTVQVLEFILAVPFVVFRFLSQAVIFNPRLGPLRYLAAVVIAYAGFAILLVYVLAPLRGLYGDYWMADKIRYDSERWLATAIYDKKGHFVGTFDPQLDSKRDVNYTGVPIEVAGSGYIANPDHKSIPVRFAPDYYWRCLVYHEDRYIGTWWNPAGIDLWGVLKIPVSTIQRSARAGRVRFGVGGSTIPMQLARIIYKTPPRAGEGAVEKLRRKLKEWWLAPVIYRTLTKDGSDEPLKQWAANHLWLAQRTGGSDLHGVEMTARVVFGKEAQDLTAAEQFVLAAAVNKPIILLEGSDRLNRVRLDRWRYIVEVRARRCANALIANEERKKEIWFQLAEIANGPPDPQVRPTLEAALQENAPQLARQARANPALRTNVLIPAARYGVREEMKQDYGYEWRNYVRGVELTFDVTENRRFRERVLEQLTVLQKAEQTRISGQYSLDIAGLRAPDAPAKTVPNVVIAAANVRGEIVRYFAAKDTAAYFGSVTARSAETGRYEAEREPRAIASLGKMMAAVALGNHSRDNLASRYTDTRAPARGLESCRRRGNLTRSRRAEVVFACSLSGPLEGRLARVGQRRLQRIIDGFGFNMPPAPTPEGATPPSTAIVRGLVTGSPRKVHQMAGVILASLTGNGARPLPLPSLVHKLSRSVAADQDDLDDAAANDPDTIVPDALIRPEARRRVRDFLSAPLCYEFRKKRIGTLKSLGKWCARRHRDIKLHFAKTGTQVTEDPDATVDAWVAGGLQFRSGAAYSYVVVVGTGSTSEPWARKLHAAQLAAPLVNVLIADLLRKETQTAQRTGVARKVTVAKR